MSARSKTTSQLINGLVHLRQKAAKMKTTATKRRSSAEIPQIHGYSFPAIGEVLIDQGNQLGVDDLMEVILASAAGLGNADHAFFYVYDPDTDALELKRAFGCPDEHIGYQMKQGAGLIGKVLRTGKPMVVNDYQSWEGHHPDPRWKKIQAVIALPLMFDGQVMGVLGLAHTQEGKTFGKDEMAALSRFSALASVVLLNETVGAQVQQELSERKRIWEELQRRNDHLRETFVATINALATTIEMKDPYTAAHQRWVTRLVCAIAGEMDLSKEQIEGLRMAGLIHDIGKMNVPAELLLKPRRLTEIEYEAIKIHPQSGYDIVKEIQFPWPIAQIVLQHHERMDGSGYPQGISGTEILVEARLLAVADVVESMSSHRPYRDAHGIDIALDEIVRNSGILYDPEAVEACLGVFKNKGFKFE
ncbi:MAG: GAF domain-containing protein [Desulfobacterales bacterium]|nr:GAF domain-containing protein [Desulfobacterales bacterium]